MAILNLFEECLDYTVSGIKNLKLCTKLENGSSIKFPIDVIIKNGDESVILGSINEANQTVTIGTQTMQYVEPYTDNSSFIEESTKDRQGKYYTVTIDFQFPKINLESNKILKDFLFTSNGELAIANAMYIITDNNNKVFIGSYDLPAIVQNLDVTTGGSDNLYSMTLSSKSYHRIRIFENI